MDNKAKDSSTVKNSCKIEPLVIVDSEKVELSGKKQEEEEKASLLPSRRGGLSKTSGKPRMKVQWNDKVGNKLVEVVEFQRSDVSDSDDDDSDSCICAIM